MGSRREMLNLSHLLFLCPVQPSHLSPHSLLQPYGASPGFGKEPAPPVAVWKGHSFNTISGREAEKFSGKDSGKGDSDFNDSDSDISGDALKKDLINHMQSGKGASPQPRPVAHLPLPTSCRLKTPVPSSLIPLFVSPVPARPHSHKVRCKPWKEDILFIGLCCCCCPSKGAMLYIMSSYLYGKHEPSSLAALTRPTLCRWRPKNTNLRNFFLSFFFF